MSALHERLCEACMRILGEAGARSEALVGELAGSLEQEHCRALAADWMHTIPERDAFAEFLRAQRAERFEIGYAKGCAARQHLQDSGIDLAEEVLRLRKLNESGDFKDIYAEGLMLGQRLAMRQPAGSKSKIDIAISFDPDATGAEIVDAIQRAMRAASEQRDEATPQTVHIADGSRVRGPRYFEKLFCPWCGKRHVDMGEFADRPHHTHRCVDDPWGGKGCGREWRLAEYVFGHAGDPPEPTDVEP